jgi:hypothetical protein
VQAVHRAAALACVAMAAAHAGLGAAAGGARAASGGPWAAASPGVAPGPHALAHARASLGTFEFYLLVTVVFFAAARWLYRHYAGAGAGAARRSRAT